MLFSESKYLSLASSHTFLVLRDAEIQRKTELVNVEDLKNNCQPRIRSRRKKLFHFLSDHFETLILKIAI
jgi:hypothetical protein